MYLTKIIYLTIVTLVFAGCVSNKKFNKMKEEQQGRYDALSKTNQTLDASLKSCNDKTNELTQANGTLQDENLHLHGR